LTLFAAGASVAYPNGDNRLFDIALALAYFVTLVLGDSLALDVPSIALIALVALHHWRRSFSAWSAWCCLHSNHTIGEPLGAS
jgi:hypothetical protein